MSHWEIPFSAASIAQIDLLFPEKKKSNQGLLDQLRIGCKARGYSSTTQKTCSGIVERFLERYGETGLTGDKAIFQEFFAGLNETQATASIRLTYPAIGFFYRNVLKQKLPFYTPPRKSKRLPDILSESEVMRLLEVTENAKHRAILTMAYGSGLRVSEIVRLKSGDFDRERVVLKIRKGKGRKDRLTLLSTRSLDIVDRYLKETSGEVENWIFPGQKPGSHITIRTAEAVFSRAKMLARIPKNVSIHSLRHAFVTHLLERGTCVQSRPFLGMHLPERQGSTRMKVSGDLKKSGALWMRFSYTHKLRIIHETSGFAVYRDALSHNMS